VEASPRNESISQGKTQVKTGETRYDLGIDVGSISTKVVLLRDGRDVVGRKVEPTSMEPDKLANTIVGALLKERGLDIGEIKYVVATGQGRKSIRFADMARTEITAFAKGAYFLLPEAEVAVDAGGQGTRVMKMGEMGIISDFRTNVKCSSCTGCFLDTMAMALDVGIGDVGELSQKAGNPESINTTCTVFAESEVVSLVAKGKSKEDILAGLNDMVAKKIGRLINATRSRGPVFVGGGVGLNTDVITKLRDRLDRKIFVPQHPQFVGALGAALMAPRPSEEDDDEDYEDDELEKKGGFLFGRKRRTRK
jgi:predicted CoA-substrate-specific enzyme activase